MRHKLARAITPDEINAYHMAGVVLLRGVLDLQTVNLLRSCIDDGLKSLNASASAYDLTGIMNAYAVHDDASLAQADGGQHDISGLVEYVRQSGKQPLVDALDAAKGSFFVDTALASRHDRFRRLIMAGPFAEIAGALLGSNEVRYYHDQLFVKEPQTRERTAYHQDATYLNVEGDDCCVLWVPADPVTLENGALQYVRGSHRDGRLYAPNVFVTQTVLPGSVGEPVPDIEGHPEDFDIVHFDTQPGDVLVHHYRTLHGAGGNLHRYQPRRAASIRYTGDDIRSKTRPGAPLQPQLKGEAREGCPLNDLDHPVVFRRRAASSEAA